MLVVWEKVGQCSIGQLANHKLEVRPGPEGWRVLVDDQLTKGSYPTEDQAMGAVEGAAYDCAIDLVHRKIRSSFPPDPT
jgi:hypothetical protein